MAEEMILARWVYREVMYDIGNSVAGYTIKLHCMPKHIDCCDSFGSQYCKGVCGYLVSMPWLHWAQLLEDISLFYRLKFIFTWYQFDPTKMFVSN